LARNLEVPPGVERHKMKSNLGVKSDAKGNYPVAMPGRTKVL